LQWIWRGSSLPSKAIERIKSEDIERLFYPVIDPSVPKPELTKRKLATGINAVPGAAVGKGRIHRCGSRIDGAKGEKYSRRGAKQVPRM